MSVPEVGRALGRGPIPRPRPTQGDDAVRGLPADQPVGIDGSARPAAPPAWPEPGRSAVGARPMTDYWDVETASWRSRGPLPGPRRAN